MKDLAPWASTRSECGQVPDATLHFVRVNYSWPPASINNTRVRSLSATRAPEYGACAQRPRQNLGAHNGVRHWQTTFLIIIIHSLRELGRGRSNNSRSGPHGAHNALSSKLCSQRALEQRPDKLFAFFFFSVVSDCRQTEPRVNTTLNRYGAYPMK